MAFRIPRNTMPPEEIPWHNFRLLMPILRDVKSCLELGCKKRKNRLPYKAVFERLGITHVSVDYNGLHGSVAMDLRVPLNIGTYDLVTNYGTTEHVDHQEGVWRNIAVACDRWFVSVTPAPGRWANHGIWYPTEEFYREFARWNGFEIEELTTAARQGSATKWQTSVRMRRVTRVPFHMPPLSLLSREAEADKYVSIPRWNTTS